MDMLNTNYQQITKQDLNKLKYQCFQPHIREYIGSLHMSDEIKTHINELYDLILYQMQRISRQESEMISIKHKNAWTKYDKPLDQYDKSQRRFLTTEEIEARKQH